MTEYPQKASGKVTVAAKCTTCLMQEFHNHCELQSSDGFLNHETAIQVDDLANNFCGAVFLKVTEFTDQVKLKIQQKTTPKCSAISAISEGTVSSTLNEINFLSMLQPLQGNLANETSPNFNELAKGLCDEISLKTAQFNDQLKSQVQEESSGSNSINETKHQAAVKKAHLMIQIQGIVAALTNRILEFPDIAVALGCKHK